MKSFEKIASEAFKLPLEGIRDDLSSRDVPQWDSMNYLFFIAELEKNFGMSFTMDEVMNASCLGDLRKVVNERGRK